MSSPSGVVCDAVVTCHVGTGNNVCPPGSGRLSLPANLLAKLGGTLGSVLRVSLRPAPTPGPATPAGPGEPAEWVFLCVAGPFPQQHGASSARTAPALLDPSVQLPDSLGRLADPATLARAPASGGRRPPLVHQARVSLLGPPATTAAASCTVAAPPALAASPALPLQLAGRLVAAGCRVLLDPSRGADAAIDVLTTEPPSSAGRGHAVRITPSTHISVVGGAPRGAELPNDAEPASGAGSFRRFAGEAREGSEGGGAGVGRGVDEGSGGEEDQLGESLGKLALTEEPGDANGEERAGGAGEAATGATGAAVTGEWASDATLAGSGEAMASIREVVVWPVQYAREAAELGVRWPTGALVHGPPGVGKSTLVAAAAREAGAVLVTVTAAAVAGAFVGETEERLRACFARAREETLQGRPVVVFFDDVDTLCPKRGSARQHETRVVAQVLTLLDGAASVRPPGAGHLVFVAATSRPGEVDPALRRPGRLERDIAVPVPTQRERLDMLRLRTRRFPLAHDVDLETVSRRLHGFTAADVASLCREAAVAAIADAADATQQAPPVTALCFEQALARVRPSLARGFEAPVAHTTWDNIGGADEAKRRLRQTVEWPLLHPDAFARMSLAPPRGVLLYGPPGCSKTTLARAAATATGVAFVPLSCAQLYSKYLGEGESLLRDAFRQARLAAPSIVFLDEADAVAAKRTEDDAAGGSEAGLRLLSTLLTEMDGLELATGVVVLAATNRPWALDSALLRPGRFDRLVYVPPPAKRDRLDILRIHAGRSPLAEDVDLDALASRTEGFTGAELQMLCREAALAALREDGPAAIHQRHFDGALRCMRPALDAGKMAEFERFNASRQRAS